MRKTSVYLSDEDAARLAALAHREGVPQAELLRRAIRGYRPARPANRDFRLAAVADGPGGSVAQVSDEALLEGFGE